MKSEELYNTYNELENKLIAMDDDDPGYTELDEKVQKAWDAYCAACDREEWDGID